MKSENKLYYIFNGIIPVKGYINTLLIDIERKNVISIKSSNIKLSENGKITVYNKKDLYYLLKHEYIYI